MRRRDWLAALAGGLSVGACSPREPLSIGFMGPLSGRRGDLGTGGRNGAMLAVELANGQGGVGGRPLRLLVEDDQLDPARARAGFSRLQDEGMLALVGAYTKPVCDAIAPLAAAASIPIVSPNLAIAGATAATDLVFRLNRTTRQNAQAYATQLHRAGQRRVTVVSELSSEEFVTTWLAQFRASLQGLGCRVSRQISYTSGPRTSFDALVDQALVADETGAEGDGVLLIAPTVDVARLCQALRLRRPRMPVAAIDRAGDQALLQLGGRAVEGLVLLQSFDPDGQGLAYLRFARAYQDRFGELPGQSAVMAHDATALVHQALLRHAAAPGALRRSIASGSPYQGLQQPMQVDPQGLAARSAWFVAVRGGRFATIGPA